MKKTSWLTDLPTTSRRRGSRGSSGPAPLCGRTLPGPQSRAVSGRSSGCGTRPLMTSVGRRRCPGPREPRPGSLTARGGRLPRGPAASSLEFGRVSERGCVCHSPSGRSPRTPLFSQRPSGVPSPVNDGGDRFHHTIIAGRTGAPGESFLGPGGFAPADPPTPSLVGPLAPHSAPAAHSLALVRGRGGFAPADPPTPSLVGPLAPHSRLRQGSGVARRSGPSISCGREGGRSGGSLAGARSRAGGFAPHCGWHRSLTCARVAQVVDLGHLSAAHGGQVTA